MTPEERFTEERKQNRVAYAIEDFYEAIHNLNRSWLGNLGLALFIGISNLLGGDNTVHIVMAVLSGGLVYVAQRYFPLTRFSYILIALAAYLLVLVTEIAFFGVPDPLSYFLSPERGWVGTLPMLNALTPYVYLGARLGFSIYLLVVYLKRAALGRQSLSVVRRLDPQLAGKVE